MILRFFLALTIITIGLCFIALMLVEALDDDERR